MKCNPAWPDLLLSPLHFPISLSLIGWRRLEFFASGSLQPEIGSLLSPLLCC
jgi:hypothetical protein